MGARFRKFMQDLRTTFWVVPMVLVFLCVVAAFVALEADRIGWSPEILKPVFYQGGESGARTLLGAIATSSIGVTGTLFSITIAALTLASSQMGPRLLDNFTRDRGNQLVLGVFLGAFAYCLVVLRHVRGGEETLFVPQVALAGAMGLALICVGLLVYYVHHMSSRINIDTVIDLVRRDFFAALDRLPVADETPEPSPSGDVDWAGAARICDSRNGYLQQLDEGSLLAWAAETGARVRLLIRPGDFVMAGGCVALVLPAGAKGAEEAVRNATALGARRAFGDDLEYSARQLVEVAVRALSPGVNDPITAIAVLDQMGAALCRVVGRRFPDPCVARDGRVVLQRAVTDYGGLVAAMFDMIRQNGNGSPAVLIHMIEVLTLVAEQERDPARLKVLASHADKAVADGRRLFGNARDLSDLMMRKRAFGAVSAHGGPARRLAPAI